MSLEAKLPALSGCVGEGIAYEFVTYCEVYKHIPTYKDILANPRGIHITNEPMMLAALSGMVGSTVTVKDLSQIMPYIHRLLYEMQPRGILSLRRSRILLIGSPSMQKHWFK